MLRIFCQVFTTGCQVHHCKIPRLYNCTGALFEFFNALASLDGQDAGTLKPEEIVNLDLTGKIPPALETVEVFCAWLGDVACDVTPMCLAPSRLSCAAFWRSRKLEPNPIFEMASNLI